MYQVIRLYHQYLHFNCHLYLNKAGGKMILKKALVYSNIFISQLVRMTECWSCSINRHCEDLLYYFFDIPCMFKIFCCKKMKTELKFITITYFLMLALSEIMQSTVYITQLHLIYSPLKSLAEVGSLVTSLIRLPQIVLSSPYNCLIISISKLSNTLCPFSFCCLFCF